MRLACQAGHHHAAAWLATARETGLNVGFCLTYLTVNSTVLIQAAGCQGWTGPRDRIEIGRVSGHTDETRADDSLENSYLGGRKKERKGKIKDEFQQPTSHLPRAVRAPAGFPFRGPTQEDPHGRYQRCRSTVRSTAENFAPKRKKKNQPNRSPGPRRGRQVFVILSRSGPPPHTPQKTKPRKALPGADLQARETHVPKRKGWMRSIRAKGKGKKEG